MVSTHALARITSELSAIGFSLTSYSELGLLFDAAAVEDMHKVVGADEFDADAAANVDNMDDMRDMAIARGMDTLRVGSEFATPLMDLLLYEDPLERNDWSLYAINRYDKVGASFEPHMDPPRGTVIVVSVSGRRSLGIYRRDADQTEDRPETFREIERSLLLVPGSILLIDGELGPPHEARCLEAPSLSLVIDVPFSMRDQVR